MKNEPVCNDVICYDPETQSWEKITKMKEPRHHHAGKFVTSTKKKKVWHHY